MRRKLLHLLFFITSSLFCLASVQAQSPIPNPNLFSAQERAWIAAHPIVHIAVDPDWRPLEYVEDGRHKGLTAEYVAAISAATGLQFLLVPGSGWSSAQQALKDGKVDMLPAISRQFAQPSLRDVVLFSDPYFVGSTIIVTTEAEPIIFDARKLNGKVVAIKGGGAYQRLLGERFPGIKLLPLQSPEAALQAVVDGRADAAIGVDTALLPLLRRKYLGTLHISGTIGEMPATVSMGVRKDLPELASIVQKTLASLTAKQTDGMMEKWLQGTDYGAPSWRTLLQYYDTEITSLVIAISLILLLAQRARVARRAAVRSEREKSKFLAVMTHEIRTPMNAILSSVELLQRSALDKRQQELATLAASAAENLLGLLDDVLDLSKLEADKLELEEVPTDIVSLTQNAIDMIQIKAQEKNLAMQLDARISENQRVLIDPTRVRQVLLNLLSNAVKFTDRGGVTVLVNLQSESVGLKTILQVTVVDTGIGVSDDQKKRLFQPFSQADSSTTRRYGGTGLGLVICRELIEKMGGTLRLQSEVGVGTSISFSIPVETQLCDPVVVKSPVADLILPPVGAANNARPTILVVDDHPNNRVVIQHQLEELNCDVVLAEDGPSGLSLLAAREFSLILLDCYLPGMDGYQVARMIRKQEEGSQRHQPIVAISAAVDEGHVKLCMDSGMDGVLRKPLRLNELKSIIEVWCDVDVVMQERSSSSGAPVSSTTELFRDSSHQDFSEIQRAFDSGDHELMARYVHRIKGAALMAGAPAIVDASERIEAILHAGSSVDADSLGEACSNLGVEVERL